MGRENGRISKVKYAGVAKLADASALGADARKGMQVQFLSPAPLLRPPRRTTQCKHCLMKPKVTFAPKLRINS